MATYYSVQERSFLTDHVINDHFVGPDDEQIKKGSFASEMEDYRAYQWMKTQMEKKLGSTNHYPIWLWKDKLPDLYLGKHQKPALKMNWVVVEFDLDPIDVVESCYEAWHMPLNNTPMLYDEKTFDDYLDNKVSMTQKEIEATWHEVFDLVKLRANPEEFGGAEEIQACTPSIHVMKMKGLETFNEYYKRERRKLWDVRKWIKNKEIPWQIRY